MSYTGTRIRLQALLGKGEKEKAKQVIIPLRKAKHVVGHYRIAAPKTEDGIPDRSGPGALCFSVESLDEVPRIQAELEQVLEREVVIQPRRRD